MQSGTKKYYCRNLHGDVVLSQTTGNSAYERTTYNAWGEILSDSNTHSGIYSDPIRYAGQYYDYESGMTYLRARYYDSEIRRFISEDPAEDGLNWYVYCGNNPVMFVDPMGLGYTEVVEALETIYYCKNIMLENPSYTVEYLDAYDMAMEAKSIIANDEIYVENWSDLSSQLDSIVNGNNNSPGDILRMISAVNSAKEINKRQHITNDILFTAGLAVVIAPAVKVAIAYFGSETVSEGLNFSAKAAQHMSESVRFVPVTILQEAIKHGVPSPDPQGTNMIMYTIQMFRNGKEYTLEVLYDSITNTVCHFKYWR